MALSMARRLYALGILARYSGDPEDPGPMGPTYPDQGDGSGGGSGSAPGGSGGGAGRGGVPGPATPPPPPVVPPTIDTSRPPRHPPIPGQRTLNSRPTHAPPNYQSGPPAGDTPKTVNPKQTPKQPNTTKRTVVEDTPGALVNHVYGQKPVTALFPYRAVDVTGQFLYCAWVVAVGQVNNIYDIRINGHAPEEMGLVLGTNYNVYKGTASQALDPILSGFDPNGWKSSLPGLAYITAKLDGSNAVAAKIDPSKVTATVEGLLVRDPRLNTNTATAPTAAAASGGVLTGYYDWNVTFVDGTGFESPGCPIPSNALTLSSQKGSLTSIPTGPIGTSTRNIYRRIKTDPNAAFRLTGSIANNIGTTFTDNTADASLGAEIPYVSTQLVYSSNPVLAHADFRTSRRYGFNEADSQVDWASVAAAANDCDFAIATPNSGPAGAPGVAFGAAYSGNLNSSVQYSWVYTFVENGIETGSSPPTSNLTPTNSRCSATLTIAAGPAGTTSRRIYRSKGVTGSQTPRFLCGEVFDNTSTTFVDFRSDYNLLSTTAPPSNPPLPRYGISAWIQQPMSIENFDNRMRANYSGYLSFDTQWHFFVDLARSPSAIVFDTTNIIGEIDITTMGLANKFGRVVVTFDDQQNGFKTTTAVVEHPNWANPPTELDRIERNEGDFTLDVGTYDQAKRLATQIFNRSRINKQVKWQSFAIGIRCMPGIVVSLTHPTGPLSSTPVIVTDITLGADGVSYQFTGEFYDATVYLDTPQYNGNPIIPPTGSPFVPPNPPTSCAVAEVDYYGDDGGLHASLSITWVPTPSPFFLGTRIDYSTDGGTTWISTGGFHAGGSYTLENVMIGTLYTIRLATVLVTLVQSDYINLTYTPDLLGTIQEVTQAKALPSAQYGAAVQFYGPIPTTMHAPRNQAPAAAPTLGLNAGGITPTGTYQVAYSRVTANLETHLSPLASITVTTGNQIIAVSNILTSDGAGGGAGVLYKKVYVKAPGWSDFNVIVPALANASTSITINSAFGSGFQSTQTPPVTFDGVSHWLLSDNSQNPPIPLYTIPVLQEPSFETQFAVPSAIYLDATTGAPTVDILVQTVDQLGNMSAGVVIGPTVVGYGTFPLTQTVTQQQALTLANGANNDVATNGIGRQRISGPTGAFNITGFTGGTAGQEITIINTTAQTMTLRNQNAGSAAGHRIICPGGADIAYSLQDQCVTLHYDETSAAWRVVGP